MNDSNDYFVDDIWLEKKKKIQSSMKGKTGERQLVKLFNHRFKDILSRNPNWGMFSRSIGSGNRWGQVTLSKSAQKIYGGDVICENFKFVVESKNGYNHIDLVDAFSGSNPIDEFLDQVSEDSQRSGKKPMLIWRKNRKLPLAFITEKINNDNITYKMYYREWTIVSLIDLLTMPDEFFFNCC